MSRVPGKRRKPKKPCPSFPLTPHNNGQWCKKVCGKIHFFGVREDPDTALQNYLSVADDLHAGRRPHEESLSDEGPTVKDVCNHSLTHPIHRAEAGEISHRWFEDCRATVHRFARSAGQGLLVSNLSVEDFQKFRRILVRSGVSGTKGPGVRGPRRNPLRNVERGVVRYSGLQTGQTAAPGGVATAPRAAPVNSGHPSGRRVW